MDHVSVYKSFDEKFKGKQENKTWPKYREHAGM